MCDDQVRMIFYQCLYKFCRQNNLMSNDHGLPHFDVVGKHAIRACEVEPSLTRYNALAVWVASILHDLDDRKLFPNSKVSP